MNQKLCKRCEYFQITGTSKKYERLNEAVCTKHDLIFNYRFGSNISKLHCIETDEDNSSDRTD